MTYKMRPRDAQTVANLRFKYKEKLDKATEIQIAEAWYLFSRSGGEVGQDNFLLWIEY